MIKLARQKHIKHKESLQNVETKKTSTGSLKTKVQARKSRKSTMLASPKPTEDPDMKNDDVMM